MTNRKCGTCRFFEVSTLQTHGWCRNAANPRRDELALLRDTELGCRSGWDNDYWEAGAETAQSNEAPISPQVPADTVAAMPIGAGLAPLKPAEAPTAPPAESATAARRRVGYQPAATPATGQDVVVGLDPRLNNHPELGENGMLLPRARRSAVAEAHRRALERREAERAMGVERRTAMASQPSSPAPPPPAREAVTEPMSLTPPAPRPAPAREVPEFRESRPFLSGAPVPEAPPTRATRESGDVPMRPPDDMASSGSPTLPAVPPSEPRYWDQPAASGRFTRMRPSPTAGANVNGTDSNGDRTRPVERVGQTRPAERPSRPIRPLGATQPVETPQFPRRGRSLESGDSSTATSTGLGRNPQEIGPRQVDPTLLQQLESDWREEALQAEAGKHCGNCRYFRSSEQSERGACDCQFAQCYRQPVLAQELGCLNPIGTWWAAEDEGWLQKAGPRRPRRATPLLDALERELAEHDHVAQSTAERRRNAR